MRGSPRTGARHCRGRRVGWAAGAAAVAFLLSTAASGETGGEAASILVVATAYNADVDLSQRFQAAAASAQQAIADCGDGASACVATELDRYADWIEGVAPSWRRRCRVFPRSSGARPKA